MSKCLVVLSGGQDSTTCLFWAKAKYDEVHAITFDYGQRHKLEIQSARHVAAIAMVDSHEVVVIGDGILAGGSFLTNKELPVEQFNSFDEMEVHNSFKENKLDSSFVPLRNQLFLTLAANRAYVLGCDDIITGVTAADFAEFGEFSWEWLGGFVDAEGCFNKVNGNGYRMSISQKDPDLFRRLGNWIKLQFPEFSYGLSSKKGCFEMTIGKISYSLISEKLSPHLHSPHRRSQIIKLSAPISDEAALTDAYVAGFWEGDGSAYSVVKQAGAKEKNYMTGHFEFQFFQKDPEVLEKISSYLNCGSLYQRNTQNCIWVLRVCDGPVRAKLLQRLKKHFCVLKSFEKITKYRHKIGMNSGCFNPPYPDCTPDFILHMESVIEQATIQPNRAKIRIVTPLMFNSKTESCQLATNLKGCMTALAYSHTSYDGKYPPTDMNHANVLRAKGFEDAGLPDPLVVRAWMEGLMDLPMQTNYWQNDLGNYTNNVSACIDDIQEYKNSLAFKLKDHAFTHGGGND